MHGSRAILIIAALLAAGCAAPAATPGADDAGAPAITSASNADLHNFTLNITMPAGQPTALVVLNVTKDMWFHPTAGFAGRRAPAERSELWVLCPWARSFGMGPGLSFITFAFWKDDSTLTPAASWFHGGGGNDAVGGRCQTLLDERGISAAAPRDGQLAIVVSLDYDPSKPVQSDTQAPAFTLSIGFGHPCDGGTMCAPERSVPTEPIARGGLPSQGVRSPACEACGFELKDDRIKAGPGWTGRASLTRTENATGILYVVAAVSPPGAKANVEITGKADGIVTHVRCTDGATPEAGILLWHKGSAELTMVFDLGAGVVGTTALVGATDNIPIDVGALGWSVTPRVAAGTLATESGADGVTGGSAETTKDATCG